MIGWICAVLLAGIAFLCFAFGNEGSVTETWDLADYGRVNGVQFEHTKAVQDDFNSIFPREISPSFEDVHYHYAASDVGNGYEFNLDLRSRTRSSFALMRRRSLRRKPLRFFSMMRTIWNTCRARII